VLFHEGRLATENYLLPSLRLLLGAFLLDVSSHYANVVFLSLFFFGAFGLFERHSFSTDVLDGLRVSDNFFLEAFHTLVSVAHLVMETALGLQVYFQIFGQLLLVRVC